MCSVSCEGWLVAAAHLPALVWLPFCAGSRARDRAGAATASRGAASRCLARRTVDSLVAQASLCTLGCPPSCETGSWVPGASGASVLYIDLSTARRGPVGAPVFLLACGPGGLAALQFGPLALRRTPHRARNRVDAASINPSYRRAKFCRERQRGRRSPLLPGAGAATQSHLAAPCDAARLACVPP